MFVFTGLMIPFAGTALGAATVFLSSGKIKDETMRVMIGFAAGVMVAASIWSLLLPAFELSASFGNLKYIPVVGGFWLGILFLFLLDSIVPHLHLFDDQPEGMKSRLSSVLMMILAVVIHNIPEGMAVGAVFAGALNGNQGISAAGAMILSIGIAIQNFPEGAIISLPLKANNLTKMRAFVYGALSGVVEPAAGYLMILFFSGLNKTLPYCLSFAAGAMIYVVVEELIPEMSRGKHSNSATMAFAAGMSVMMILDICFGS